MFCAILGEGNCQFKWNRYTENNCFLGKTKTSKSRLSDKDVSFIWRKRLCVAKLCLGLRMYGDDCSVFVCKVYLKNFHFNYLLIGCRLTSKYQMFYFLGFLAGYSHNTVVYRTSYYKYYPGGSTSVSCAQNDTI